MLFTPGCNLRCPFCHNPELVGNRVPESFITRSDIVAFLSRRQSVLGGVVITGGEPCAHDDLPDLMQEIVSLGLKVKLDTNGTFPDALVDLPLAYVAMDIKTSPDKYGLVIGDDSSTQYELFANAPTETIWDRVARSIDWIISSGIDHEFRTTVVPGIVTEHDISTITNHIKGAKRYVLAGFRPINTLDPQYASQEPFPVEVLESMKATVENSGMSCSIRLNRKAED